MFFKRRLAPPSLGLFRFQDFAAIQRLDRPVIVRIELGEGFDLRLGHVRRRAQHVPHHTFRARRRSERSRKREIGVIRRQQVLGVDGDGRNVGVLVLFLGDVRPNGGDFGIVGALVEEDSDPRSIAGVIAVHQMYFERVGFPVDVAFTRMMKVELLQRVDMIADVEGAAGGIVDHDRVAVIDDTERGILIVELQGRQVGGLGILGLDVDRRLVLACATR